MIIEEYVTMENGDKFIHHYTDDPTKTMLQVETGLTYEDAIDLIESNYTYVEIDKPEEENDAEIAEMDE